MKIATVVISTIFVAIATLSVVPARAAQDVETLEFIMPTRIASIEQVSPLIAARRLRGRRRHRARR